MLNFLESVGYLVRRHLLDLEVTEAVLAAQIRGWWSVGQSIVASGRAEFDGSLYTSGNAAGQSGQFSHDYSAFRDKPAGQ